MTYCFAFLIACAGIALVVQSAKSRPERQ
jgi:hypothetical protein